MNPLADNALHEWGGWVRLFLEGQGFGGGVDSDPSIMMPGRSSKEHKTHSDPVGREFIATNRHQERAQRIDRHLDHYPDREAEIASLLYVGVRRYTSTDRAGESQVWRIEGEIRVAKGVRFRIKLASPPEIAGRPWRWESIYYPSPNEGVDYAGLAAEMGVSERHARRLLDNLHERLAADLLIDSTERRKMRSAQDERAEERNRRVQEWRRREAA